MTNKNKDDFDGVKVRTADGSLVGVLKEIKPGGLRHIDKIREIGGFSMGASVGKERRGIAGEVPKVWLDPNPMWGPSPLREIIRDLIYLDILKRGCFARLFLDRNYQYMTDDERRMFMEKYGVEIDPKKTKKDGEKTAGADDPNVNVPKDPDKGTEPFERKPDGKEEG